MTDTIQKLLRTKQGHMEYGVLSEGAMKYMLNLPEIRLEFMSKSKSPDVCSRSLTLPRQELMMISIQVHVFYSNALNCPCASILHHAIGMSLGDLVLNEICAKNFFKKENL